MTCPVSFLSHFSPVICIACFRSDQSMESTDGFNSIVVKRREGQNSIWMTRFDKKNDKWLHCNELYCACILR